MKKTIKFLLIAFGLGLAVSSIQAQTCPDCNVPTPPAGCPNQPPVPPNGGFMPSGVNFDSIPASLTEAPAVKATDSAKSSMPVAINRHIRK